MNLESIKLAWTNEGAAEILKNMLRSPRARCNGKSFMTASIDGALLTAIAALEKTRWISVKDTLPNKDGQYLCCYVNVLSGKPRIGIYSFAKNLRKVDNYDFYNMNRAGWYGYDSECGHYEIGNVAHWMPLPELPKENSDEQR